MGILIGVGQNRPTFPYDYFYGVEFDTSVSAPGCTRIGRAELHASLPVHSLMRRCLVSDAGVVTHYLHPTDSTKYDTGAAADLSGAEGQVMVEIPDHYVKFEAEGTKRRVMMSAHSLPGFIKIPKFYISAYEAAMKRSTTQLCSVVNTTDDFRGGGNQTAWDGTHKDQRGMPVTGTSLTAFRTAARKGRDSKWNCNTYFAQKVLYWLFVVEYATLNSQAAYTAELTAEGYHQGGLGAGVSNLTSAGWNAMCGYYPFIPCGFTNSLGNQTGVVTFTPTAEQIEAYGSSFTTTVPSYRGVENPFGHIYKWTDGVLVLIDPAGDDGKSKVYVCDDPANYASTVTENYRFAGIELPRGSGWAKEIAFGHDGDILPVLLGGSATTYLCDYFYTSIPESGNAATRGLLFGGNSSYGTSDGFVFAYSNLSPSATNAYIGSRLCFMP